MSASPHWLVWTFDPCQEGGWHIRERWPTEAEAVEAAKKVHAWEKADYEAILKDHPTYRPCYSKCMVTPGPVFEMDMPPTDRNSEGT